MNKKLTIGGLVFEVQAPYTAGPRELTEAEAKTLNQTRSENVGNNLRKAIGEGSEKGMTQEQLQAIVSEYDNGYTFAMGGGSRVVIDPLEKECYKVAREAVRDALQAEGKKLKDVDEAKLEAYLDQLVAQDDVIAEAKKRLKAKQKKVQINLEGMGLPA